MVERNPEAEKQFVATTYIDLGRHGSRYGGERKITFSDGSIITFKDPTDLTPAGKQMSREFGEAYPPEVTLVHPRGGDESRHGETGEDILKGSGRFGVGRLSKDLGPARVRNGKGKVIGTRRGIGVDYKGAGLLDKFRAEMELVSTEISRLVSGLSPEEQERFKQDPEFRVKYVEMAQNIAFRKAMQKEPEVRTMAENEAYELMKTLELSRRGVKGGETKAIPIVGSGMFAESLYKYALVVEDEKTGERKIGFDDVDEIGGFTSQATALRLKLQRDTRLGDPRNIADFTRDTEISCEFTDPARAKLFEGKKVSLDWDKIIELAAAAQTKFEAEDAQH
ncbi:MAG: hypothetical protein WC817_04725 [Patescibacteria group bacterium]|jgi:hypothetical protein